MQTASQTHVCLLLLCTAFSCAFLCADGRPLTLPELCQDLPQLVDYDDASLAKWAYLTATVRKLLTVSYTSSKLTVSYTSSR